MEAVAAPGVSLNESTMKPQVWQSLPYCVFHPPSPTPGGKAESRDFTQSARPATQILDTSPPTPPHHSCSIKATEFYA